MPEVREREEEDSCSGVLGELSLQDHYSGWSSGRSKCEAVRPDSTLRGLPAGTSPASEQPRKRAGRLVGALRNNYTSINGKYLH